jgi:CHRD domain
MSHDRKALRLIGVVEGLEERTALSGGFGTTALLSHARHGKHHGALRFVARLSGASVVTTSSGSTTIVTTPAQSDVNLQITPAGDDTVNVQGSIATTVSTTAPTTMTLGVSTPATGAVSFQVSSDGRSISVVGSLSKISNVSVIDLHEGAAGANGPTVDILLNPGSPGPTPRAPFETVIKAPYLTGPLTGKPLRALIKAMESGNIYVSVQTSNGADASGPFFPGNYPAGEIRGQVTPVKR